MDSISLKFSWVSLAPTIAILASQGKDDGELKRMAQAADMAVEIKPLVQDVDLDTIENDELFELVSQIKEILK